MACMAAAATETSMTRTLSLAAQAIGGSEALAEKLGVATSLVQEWLAGASEPPTAMYVRVLDVLISAPKQKLR